MRQINTTETKKFENQLKTKKTRSLAPRLLDENCKLLSVQN